MALRITAANKPIIVDQLVLALYSLPGIGKTTTAFTAERPILLDADKGSYRAKNRKDVVQIGTWKDVAEMTKDDLTDYATIVCDTVGRLLDFLSADIIEANPKHGYMGNLSLQGYGVLKGRFTGVLNQWRTWGKDIVLLAHMDEKTEGEVVKERFDIQGGSKMEIYKSSDAIAKLYIQGKKRMLDFSPREGSLGKNPAQFEVIEVPDYRKEPLFLAGVVQNIKNSINKLSEDQKQEADAIEGWRKLITACKTPANFNSLLPTVKQESQIIKALMMAVATERGMKFDKDGGEFYAPQSCNVAEAAPEPPTQPEAPPPLPEGGKASMGVPSAGNGHPSESSRRQSDSLIHQVVKVGDAEQRNRKKGGQYWLLTCTLPEMPDVGELAVHVWDKKLFEYVKGAVGKECEFGLTRSEKDDSVFYALDEIYRIGDVTFEGNAPAGTKLEFK